MEPRATARQAASRSSPKRAARGRTSFSEASDASVGRHASELFYLVADWEADQWFAPQAAEELCLERLRGSCSASVNQSLAETWLAARSDVGFFCMTNTIQDLLALPDPRPKLRRDETPALVLRGECDTLAWSSALAYRQTLPNARLAPVRGAGHFIWLDQPEMCGRVVAASLSDAPPPIADYAGVKRPW